MKRKLMMFLALFFMGIGVITAQTQVRGTVVDDAGEPVIGATIQIQGTTQGTVTDINGNFTLSAPASGKLVVSFVGYTTQIVAVGPNVQVVLLTDTQILDEVLIVVPYGTARKSTFTGSAAVVNTEQIGKIQTSNISKALEGAVAGVQVLGGTGQPGSSAAIRIRGIGSVNSSSAPLYVLDGAAYDGDLNSINSEDIESISVLKDAAAASLYGARGANGVVMITTKKGKAGKATVSAKANLGTTSRAIPEYDRVNTQQYYELMWEGWKNSRVIAGNMTEDAAAALASGDTPNGIVRKLGGYNPYNIANDQLIGLDGKMNPNAQLLYQDDWYDALSQNGLRQDYNIAVNGGVDKTTYYISLGYLNEEGHVKWSDYDRITGRVGVDSRINDWFKVDASLSGTTANTLGFLAEGTYTTNPFYYSRMMGPIYPIYQRNSDGSIASDANGNQLFDMGGGSSEYAWDGHTRPYAPNSNLVVTLPLDIRGNKRNSLTARVAADITFAEGLNLRIMGSNDIRNIYYTTYQNNKYGDAEAVEGRSTKEYSLTNSYTFNQVLTYNKSFNDVHDISVLLGHENYKLQSNNVWATRTGFKFPTDELIAGAVAEGSSSYKDEYTLEGYFSNLSYAYNDKYYLSGSVRYDGSSRFSRKSRWGGFWSLGASWRIKQETFLQDVDWIDDLKFKASYGEQGNDAISTYYGYQSLFSIDDTNNANKTGSIYSKLANDDLQWEKNSNFNTGLEFSLLDGRLRGGFEYFIRQSSNLLFEVPLPQSTGISVRWENVGTMKNNGIELQVTGDIVRTPDFGWTIDVNATHYKNKITKMPVDNEGKPKEIVSGTKKLSEGHSIYDFWLRDFVGVDPENGAIQFNKDILDDKDEPTGEKEITNDHNAASYYYLGSAIPDIYGGVTNTFRYKGFDLSVFFTYSIGGLFYDSNYAALMHTGAFGSHMHVDLLDRWTPENKDTNVTRLQNNYTSATAASDRWLTDAGYLSLRNITIGYTFPKSLINRLDLSSLRIFATGDNLGLRSARKGMDPQQAFTGVADHTYAPTRTLGLGINLTF